MGKSMAQTRSLHDDWKFVTDVASEGRAPETDLGFARAVEALPHAEDDAPLGPTEDRDERGTDTKRRPQP